MRRRVVMLKDFGRVIAGYKAIRVMRDPQWDEYRVEFVFVDGSVSEVDTYFCDDKDDAIDTARHEFDRIMKIKPEFSKHEVLWG